MLDHVVDFFRDSVAVRGLAVRVADADELFEAFGEFASFGVHGDEVLISWGGVDPLDFGEGEDSAVQFVVVAAEVEGVFEVYPGSGD
ncbi:hypothetical protein CQ015_09880 [Arthrobacter sp. MYb221]|nr:hypothetical protein CQ015_09880 [Arthrobacter sp. MYb221]